MQGLFSSDAIRAAIRRWYIARHDDLDLGGETLEQMSTCSLIDVIREHGTADEIAEVVNHINATFGMNDPQGDERRANIEAANREFNVMGPQMAAKVPEGPGLDVFQPRRKHPTVTEALTATREWLTGDGPAMLTLAGDPGVGKTHLAIAAARDLADRGVALAYRTEPDMLGETQSHFGDGSSSQELADDFGRIDWLIIDDFGRGLRSDWSREFMDVLIDRRWRAAAGGVVRTMVTTNLRSNELPARMGDRLGDVSRGLVIQVDATSYRREGVPA